MTLDASFGPSVSLNYYIRVLLLLTIVLGIISAFKAWNGLGMAAESSKDDGDDENGPRQPQTCCLGPFVCFFFFFSFPVLLLLTTLYRYYKWF